MVLLEFKKEGKIIVGKRADFFTNQRFSLEPCLFGATNSGYEAKLRFTCFDRNLFFGQASHNRKTLSKFQFPDLTICKNNFCPFALP